MAKPIIMPGEGSMETARIMEWKKEIGDKVNVGDIICEVETDKAAIDIEAPIKGTILDIFFNDDIEVPIQTTIAVIGTPDEDYSNLIPDDLNKDVQSNNEEKIEKEKNINNNETRVLISPRTRRLAKEKNVPLSEVNGSGPEGRIIKKDIMNWLNNKQLYIEKSKDANKQLEEEKISEQPVNKPKYKEKELSNIRKSIAKTMYNSLQSTAQLTLHISFDATEILNYRKRIKQNMDKFNLMNITLNDIILFTISRTLPYYNKLNAHLIENKLKLFKNVHLGVAVDTDQGLMVPTIFNANLKSLCQISREVKNRTEECKDGAINPSYLNGATFTVTNLGMFGIESFTPILNPPQTGILGVNNIIEKIKRVNGEYESYSAMKLSLTFDHRALDGAPAARFLETLKNNLENWSLLIAK